LSAELTLESILKDMDNHRGGTPQSDDVTCVVVHCVNDVDLRTDASG
jgi:serine phosphatase RsbU (regulator of sigma subunit)